MLRYRFLFLLSSFLAWNEAFAQDSAPATADLMRAADSAYQAKRYSESASFYSRALALVPDGEARVDLEMSCARAQALGSNLAGAFMTLNHAMEDGFLDGKALEADQDFALLHADPRWQPLLKQMTRAAAQQDARWGDAAFATPYAPDISSADKLMGLAELWAQARYSFANFGHVPRLNWDETYRAYIPQVLATSSTAEYYRVLQSFYAQLEDGHTNVYPPDQLHLSPMPLRTRLVDGRLLILGATRSSFDLQGLHPGDEIVTINGAPAIAWARQNVQSIISASTEQDRVNRTFGNDLFRAAEGTTFSITTSTPSGAHSRHTLTVPPYAPPASPQFAVRMLPGNIAYVALNEFGDDMDANEWDKHWPEISRAAALILDLRENGGGNDSVGGHILAALIDKSVPGELSRSTQWIATSRAHGYAETPFRFPIGSVEPDPAHHFSGPVALLTSPRTFSAAEDMTVVFAQAHRGKTIGEATGGSTGQPLFFELPGGGSARVCTKHDSFADGREFVGIGVQPDIPVHSTRADIIAGRDSVLEAAIRTLQATP